MLGFFKQLLDPNKKEIKRLTQRVEAINALEPEIRALSDGELQVMTGRFKERLAQGADLEAILPEAFAVVREAAWRTLGQRHYDVQLMGGIVLHEGRIAEMKTGEGKTLAATCPVYLNALAGRGVHVVTVNDYLAQRDAQWMGAIYRFLGLEVAALVHGLDYQERKAAYQADITYGTNNEFGFDYLRDNMVLDGDQMVQRELHYAIIDEVDSILIDEARTPLIISGPGEKSTELYKHFAQLVPRLKVEEDYTVDEKARSVALTEAGWAKMERLLGLDDIHDQRHFELTHYVQQALRAHTLFKRDRDYVVKEGQVIIVDEFTGRLMPGRRYSDGLHQAIEAKEGVRVERENQTLASITFQNYFRMYDKLAGMTGTAATEEAEFRRIYGMDVVVIPTNKPMIRTDHPDVVFKTEKGKLNAVIDDILEAHGVGRPVLVGTVSIEKSEQLSRILKTKGVPHQVLNAKHHEREAEIIKDAGQPGAVTIATNMAGRGTDIVLGEGVAQLGGLHIIGTERHESRRIDNQLRGRAGRQGDPGSSRFYVSLEDDLMRLFGSERITGLMERVGWEDDQPIESPQITKIIESAQKKVEALHFDMRKQVLEYDDVMNKQREVIYAQRRQVLAEEDMEPVIKEMIQQLAADLAAAYADEKLDEDDWDLQGLAERVSDLIAPWSLKGEELAGHTTEEIREKIETAINDAYRRREEEIGSEQMRQMERIVLLRVIDSKWMEHLRTMDGLREGIGLRAYGQRDPLLEYKFEAFELFQGMIEAIREDCIRLMFRVRLVQEGEMPAPRPQQTFTNRDSGPGRPRQVAQKAGRNDPCPCGSGKKYKRCCGR
ncbi:MAG: preprotein translocase subunit SecA [Limnochordia bacterium]|jgi:preprotein translocase subunit SecA